MFTLHPTHTATSSAPRASRRASGFTLVEVMVSSAVMVIILGGVLAALIQSRRLTEGSIYQNSTVTIIQGYIEQMKTMEFDQLKISPSSTPTTPLTIPTVQDQSTPDALTLSSGTPPTTTPAIGTVPTGAVDNIKIFNINNTTTTNDDLRITIWIWIRDLDVDETDRPDVTNAKSITLIYTWQFKDGNRSRSYRGSIRAMRSLVPSY